MTVASTHTSVSDPVTRVSVPRSCRCRWSLCPAKAEQTGLSNTRAGGTRPASGGMSARRRDNFVRVHKTLRMSPAMGAGGSDRLWDIGNLVALVEAAEVQPAKRG